ncbi:MAG: polysaccharide deacetylase family protein [Methylacidiphilaceae bacterium]|nr:polysaccharide deacetylase family protein [Candidatus Methylacidiphilaceae bacterium]
MKEKGRPALIVSLHDLHPGSLSLVARQREQLRRWGVKEASLLVIPSYHHGPSFGEDSEFCRWVDLQRKEGDETVVHGYFHSREERAQGLRNWFWTEVYTRREAEFFDLPDDVAGERLRLARALFARQGWPTEGFVAPGWLMDPRLPRVLAREGFRYTTRIDGILSLRPEERWTAARTYCWSTRAAWRRATSLAWNHLLSPVSSGSVVRVSLHPSDFAYRSIRAQIERIVKQALDRHGRPLSYLRYVSS